MSLPPYGRRLTVRPEILDPRGLLDMVDLGAVSGRAPRGVAARTPGMETLRDPGAFFDITFPSAEIVGTLRTLGRRAVAPESVPGTILLSGRYGHGKSHVLLAAHHGLTAPEVAQRWADRWSLGELHLPPNPLVVTRSFIQHADEPLWDMLLAALSEGRKPKVGDFPDGQRIESLLGDRPVFVIMDELERWYDAQDDLSKSRNRNFLQALTEVSMRDGRLTVLGSVLGEKEEPAETIRRVRPMELSFRSAEDRQRVVLFRLFTDRDAPDASIAAAAVADAYVASWQAAGVRDLDGMRARVIASWPFTPELLDILTRKIPNLNGFQNTRGTLRFLAHVVRSTRDRRALVSSQDIPFLDDDVHQALLNLDTTGGEVVRRALGDNYAAVPAELPHRDELFSTLVFYSVADPTHPGATLDEILLATLDPRENPLRVRDALAQLKQRAFNLHERDQRYVFLAVENPHARVNAMASSQLVTREAARDHVLAALAFGWKGTDEADRTVVFEPAGWDAAARRLRELRAVRPRVVLSTLALNPKERLRLQNLDEERNLVLIVEPTVRTSSGDAPYTLLGDEALLHHARRVEACRLLLEGRPVEPAATVYRTVRDEETARLRKAVAERYGVAIAWHKAGPTGADVDDTWYEICRLDKPSCGALLDLWRADLTGLPEVTAQVRARWSEFRTRTVADLCGWFDRTPGAPVPIDATWVPAAARELARAGVFSLVGGDGAVLAPARVATADDTTIRACSLSEPVTVVPPPEIETKDAIAHPRASAQYDAGRRGVLVSWTLPPLPPEGGTYTTLVQRYTSARGWEEGKAYPIDPGESHEANRYVGADESFLDDERLQPGEWYFYYVFLVHEGPDRFTYCLSRRCDVSVPRVGPTPEGVIESSLHPDPNKLAAEIERLVMSGKHMNADARVRKVEVVVRAITAPIVREQLAGSFATRATGAVDASADLTFVTRGAYNRQEVVALLRALPRYEGASYAATLHLKGDDGSARTTQKQR
jgi:hypothetical protein